MITSYMLGFRDKIERQFIEVYNKNADAIFRYCYYRIFDRERAKELMQESFTKSWEYLAQGKEVANLRAFVYKTAVNLIIDEARKKKDKSSLEELKEKGWEKASGQKEEELVEIKLQAEKIARVIKQLNKEDSEIIIMRHINGLPPKDIAEILGESANVISVRLNRAMKQLRALLKTTKI